VTERLTADEIIAHLKLGPHPEGGYFRETFRDEPGHKGRSHSTAILYLLRAGEVSRWHRVDAAEMWHWYGGAPLLLEVKHNETRHAHRLGQDWLIGQHPHALVPPGAVAKRPEPRGLDADRLNRSAGIRLLRLRTRP
jgi:hypothetical protein